MSNKNRRFASRITKEIVLVIAGVAAIWIGTWIALGSFSPFYVVSSGSMVPSLNIDDLIVVADGDSFSNVEVGDIIVFHRPSGEDRVIVHRIIEVLNHERGERILRTKGDANPAPIPGTDYPILRNDYIGEVVYVLPGIGAVSRILSPPVNYILIAGILAALVLYKFANTSRNRENSRT